MNDKFDELTKAMAQSLTRRSALKKFGVGLAGAVLACFGLADRAQANDRKVACQNCIAWCRWGGTSYFRCHEICVQAGYCKR